METSAQLLEKLSNVYGVSGDEGDIRSIIMNELKGIVEFSHDGLGSLICMKKGTAEAPKIMIAAHMDEIGFIVRYVTSDGFIKFHPLGGWWSHAVLAQRVIIRTATGVVRGVVGAKPVHHLKNEEMKKNLAIEDMFIDIGAVDKTDVMQTYGVRPGDPVIPDSEFTFLNNSRIVCGKAFDNRIGTALMIDSMKYLRDRSHPNTVFGTGTVQEEVGLRGAATSTALVDPDIALVLEGTPADDLPGVSKDEIQGRLGGGPQIRLYDPSMITDRKLSRIVMEVAEKRGIPYQTAVRTGGGTDAGRIHLHGTGIPTMVIAAPVRYAHSHVGVASLDDYDNTLKLVVALIESLDENTLSPFKGSHG